MRGAGRLGGLLVALVVSRTLYRALRPSPAHGAASGGALPGGPGIEAGAQASDPRRRQREHLRAAAVRLGIATVLCLAAVLLRQWSANDKPPFRASLVAINPTQGAPVSVTGVPTSAPGADSPPPIDSTFRSLSVERLRSGRPGTVLIHLVVAPPECQALLHEFGGTCGADRAPPRTSGELELSLMRPGTTMSADFWLAEPGTVELAETGPPTGLGIPTGWTVESDSQTTQVDLFCGGSTVVISARSENSVQCAIRGADYVLPVESDEGVQPSLSLSGVSSLNADLEGVSAGMTVGEGELSREGEFETLASAKPLEVELRGSRGHPVVMAAHSQAGSGEFTLAMSAAQAHTIEWEGEDHTRSRLDRQPELAYALLGVLAGFFLVALADFAYALLAGRRVGW